MGAPLRLIDLFCGAGGMTEGFRQTGQYELVDSVELDLAAAASYSLNHGGDHLYVGGIADWRESHGEITADVIIGGPPCQGFSALGKQDVQDERNLLWQEYALAIVASRPRYFVIENVAQFLTSPQFRDLREWTEPHGALSNYEVHPFLLNASDFGSYQSRKRAVVIGRHRDLPPVPEPTGTHVGDRRTVRDAFVGMPARTSAIHLPERTLGFHGATIAGPYTSKELHVGRDYSDLSLARFATIPVGGNRFNLPEPLKAECWKKHTTGSGDVMGRLHWDRPSVTIRTEFFKPEKGRYLHPVENRAITHFEAARLQGFPDDYRWAGSKTAIARQIGNAVPVQLSRALGEFVAALPR